MESCATTTICVGGVCTVFSGGRNLSWAHTYSVFKTFTKDTECALVTVKAPASSLFAFFKYAGREGARRCLMCSWTKFKIGANLTKQTLCFYSRCASGSFPKTIHSQPVSNVGADPAGLSLLYLRTFCLSAWHVAQNGFEYFY